MALTYTSDPNLLIEIGRLLKQARIKEDLPLKDMAKWLGMRIEQIQAIEDGNPAFLLKNNAS
jgi:cytoskeletal protein RodZ